MFQFISPFNLHCKIYLFMFSSIPFLNICIFCNDCIHSWYWLCVSSVFYFKLSLCYNLDMQGDHSHHKEFVYVHDIFWFFFHNPLPSLQPLFPSLFTKICFYFTFLIFFPFLFLLFPFTLLQFLFPFEHFFLFFSSFFSFWLIR